MKAKMTGIGKTIMNFQERFKDLDAMTVDQLANSLALERVAVYTDYLYYNILMIKNSGSKLISELRKLRFERFIRTHAGLFYSGEKADSFAEEQINWFNQQLVAK